MKCPRKKHPEAPCPAHDILLHRPRPRLTAIQILFFAWQTAAVCQADDLVLPGGVSGGRRTHRFVAGHVLPGESVFAVRRARSSRQTKSPRPSQIVQQMAAPPQVETPRSGSGERGSARPEAVLQVRSTPLNRSPSCERLQKLEGPSVPLCASRPGRRAFVAAAIDAALPEHPPSHTAERRLSARRATHTQHRTVVLKVRNGVVPPSVFASCQVERMPVGVPLRWFWAPRRWLWAGAVAC